MIVSTQELIVPIWMRVQERC